MKLAPALQRGEEIIYVIRALWKVKYKVLLFPRELHTRRNTCRLWGSDLGAGSCTAGNWERNVGVKLGTQDQGGLPLCPLCMAPPSGPLFSLTYNHPTLLVQNSGVLVPKRTVAFGMLFPQSFSLLVCKSLNLPHLKSSKKMQDDYKLQCRLFTFDRNINIHI